MPIPADLLIILPSSPCTSLQWEHDLSGKKHMSKEQTFEKHNLPLQLSCMEGSQFE